MYLSFRAKSVSIGWQTAKIIEWHFCNTHTDMSSVRQALSIGIWDLGSKVSFSSNLHTLLMVARRVTITKKTLSASLVSDFNGFGLPILGIALIPARFGCQSVFGGRKYFVFFIMWCKKLYISNTRHKKIWSVVNCPSTKLVINSNKFTS